MRVLVVEDDPDLARVLALYLEREGLEAETAGDGVIAWQCFQERPPDAVLLDLNLPGMSGLDLCREIRRVSDVPLIMVTARDAEADELLGLELGADDYVTKPFSPRVVAARVRAVLRRAGEQRDGESAISAGRLEVDTDTREVLVDGRRTGELRAKEFELLTTLASRPGKVFGKAELQRALYGWDSFVGSRAVDQHVSNLRGKLGDRSLIRTVRGVGYALDADMPE